MSNYPPMSLETEEKHMHSPPSSSLLNARLIMPPGFSSLPFASVTSTAHDELTTLASDDLLENSQHSLETEDDGRTHTAASDTSASNLFYSTYSRQQAPKSTTASNVVKSPSPVSRTPARTASFKSNAMPAVVQTIHKMSDSVDLSVSAIKTHIPNISQIPPNRWTTPSSIYFDVSKQQPALSYGKHSLYQELLPSAEDTEIEIREGKNNADLAHTNAERKYRDVLFAVLYVSAVTLMFILGIAYALTAEPLSDEFKTSLSYAFNQTRGYFSGIVVTSAFIGIVWLWMLKRYVRLAIWLTVLLIPMGLFGVGVWSMQNAFVQDAGNPLLESRWLIPESALAFLMSALSVVIIHRKKQHIVRGISLVEQAFEVIRDNPTIFVVSLGILAAYIVFTVVWFLLLSRILMIGHIESQTVNDHIVRQWIPDPSSKWLMAYFIFVYLWTSSVFSYLDRCAISGVVCEWYFHRQDPLRNAIKRDLAVESFTRAATYSFGSICFAGLVLTAVNTIRLVTRQIRRATRFGDNFVVRIVCLVVETIESVVEGVSSYSLVYIAYSGDNFLQATRNCLYLFRRNLLSALLMDNATKFILMMGMYVLSSISFMVTFNFAAHVTQTPYAYAISLFGCIVPFLMIRFCTMILMQVMDVLYVCYVIDLDTKKCHSRITHAIFGGDQTQPVSIQMPDNVRQQSS